jgi:sterol desaturase/sphingolipid hydroxylase (fatty acid hydroxylase superfamily)
MTAVLPELAAALAPLLAAALGQAIATLALLGAIFMLTWRWGAARLAARRVRPRGRPFDRDQLFHELRHTLAVLALGGAQALGVQALAARGLLPPADDLGPLAIFGVFIGLLALNDLWFYGAHRLLHTPWLFRHVHAVHHRSVDVNPFSSYSFHVVEAALMTAWIIPVALLVPLPLPALAAAQLVGFANNVMSHLGYELLPAWWLRAPLLSWSNTATFHSLHHSRPGGNYGLCTRIWDRLFGTEHSAYAEAFAAAHPTAASQSPADIG